MKNTKYRSLIIALLLAFVLSFSNLSIVSASGLEKGVQESLNIETNYLENLEDSRSLIEYADKDITLHDDGYITVIFPEMPISPDQSFEVKFEVDKNAERYEENSNKLISFDYQSEGLQVLSKDNKIEKSANEATLSLRLAPNALTAKIDLNFVTEEDELTSEIYALNTEYGIFLNQYSEDNLLESIYHYEYENNILSGEEYREKLIENSSKNLHEELQINNNYLTNAAAAAVGDTKVYGTIRWEDDSGNRYPAKNVIIKLFNRNKSASMPIFAQYTTDSGSYEFIVPYDASISSYKFFIEFVARTEYYVVKNNFWYDGFTYQTQDYVVSSGETRQLSYYTGIDDDYGKSFKILQALIYGQKYTKLMDSYHSFSSITVFYPRSDTDYNNILKQIQIGTNNYQYWDVILHEYGHYLQYKYDIIDSPGGSHSSWHNNIIARNSKSTGTKLAWGESWPTIFGNLVTKQFGSELTGIADINDDWYDAGGGYSLANPLYGGSLVDLGEGCERSIMGVLFNLYKYYTKGVSEQISYPHQTFWNLVTKSKAKTFSEFANYAYNTYGLNKNEFGGILDRFGFTSSTLTSSSLSSTTNPVFYVTKGTSGKHFSDQPDSKGNALGTYHTTTDLYLFNNFELVFYNEYGSQIFRTAKQSGTTFSIVLDDWAQILSSVSGTKFFVSTVSYQTSGPSTGAYESARIEFTKPSIVNYQQSFTMTTSTRHIERIATLAAGQSYEFNVTFSTWGEKVIQTTGDKDAMVELYTENGLRINDTINGLTGDDKGHGMNYLYSYYSAPNEKIKVKVRFWSSAVYGRIKLLITPAWGALQSGYSYIERYEHIYTFQNYSSFTFNTYTQLDYARMVVFIPISTKLYTIQTTGSIDTYLYVLDSTSTEAMQYGIDYDDDSGTDLNAKITRKLTAGVKYLIIYSGYNPGNQGYAGNITLKIS